MYRTSVGLLMTLMCAGCCGRKECAMPISGPTTSSILEIRESEGMFAVNALQLNTGSFAGRKVQVVRVDGYADESKVHHKFGTVFTSRSATAMQPAVASIHRSVPTVMVEAEEAGEAVAMAVGIAPIIMTRRVRFSAESTSLAVQIEKDVHRAYYVAPAGGKDATLTILDWPNQPTVTIPALHFVTIPATSAGGLPKPQLISGNPEAQAFAKLASELANAAGLVEATPTSTGAVPVGPMGTATTAADR